MSCLGEKTKNLFVKILLLDDTEQQFEIKSSQKGQFILNRVLDNLNLLEKDYFGLRYLDQSNQTHWLDVTKSIGSQFKGQQSCLVYFGVKFYAADPTKLQEEITRYQFFLQVKKDILQGRVPVNFDLAAELFALSIQSELGDFDSKRHTYGYVSEFHFAPHQTEELEDTAADLHRTIQGMVPAQAEYKFLDKVKWLDMYGVDLHPVIGDGNLEYFLGLTPTGIVIYKNQNKVGNYFWPRITKITFKGKMFTIRVRDKNNDEHSYGFSSSSKESCKHLWKCCLEHHAFFRLNQAHDAAHLADKLFSLGSKHRYSGRTERQLSLESRRRDPPHVHRTPSKRYERRKSPTVINPDTVPAVQNMDSKSSPVDAGDVQIENKPPKDSSKSAVSAPWTENGNKGLYTSGRDSPLSVRSEKMKFPAPRRMPSGSDSEAVYRRKHQSRRGPASDCDSDTSYHKRHRRRRPQDGVLKELRSNGSLNSNANSESSQKKRRRRSRSPGKKPPEELAQHFKYVEPSGFTEDQLKEIPYTSVQTNVDPIKVKYSPHSRQRQRSPRRRSYGENNTQGLTDCLPWDEAPPPYTADSAPQVSVTMNRQKHFYHDSQRRRDESFVLAVPSAYPHQAYVAPVVGTRPSPGLSSRSHQAGDSVDNGNAPHRLSTHKAYYHRQEDSGVGIDQDGRLDSENRLSAYNPHQSALSSVHNDMPLPRQYANDNNQNLSHGADKNLNDGSLLDSGYVPAQPSFRYVSSSHSHHQSASLSYNPYNSTRQDWSNSHPPVSTYQSPSNSYHRQPINSHVTSPHNKMLPPRDMMTEL